MNGAKNPSYWDLSKSDPKFENNKVFARQHDQSRKSSGWDVETVFDRLNHKPETLKRAGAICELLQDFSSLTRPKP